MKNATLAVLLAGLTFSVFASSALAQEAEDGSGAPAASEHSAAAPSEGGHEMHGAKLKEKLGLTDEQFSKLQAAWKSAKEAAKPYRDQVKADMKKLRDQVKSKASDDDIRATLEDLDTARKGLQGAMEKAHADTRSILTPTQQAKMALSMQHRMNQMRKNWRGQAGKGGDQSAEPAPQPAQ